MSERGQPEAPVAVVERDGQLVLVARARLPAGAWLCGFSSAGEAPGPGRHTLQVDIHRHVWLAPGWLAYIQHGCAPNVSFEVDAGQVRVLRPIATGEMLAAFYPATEMRLAEPFDCLCGAPDCLGRIAGAESVRREQWGNRPMSRHVRQSWESPFG